MGAPSLCVFCGSAPGTRPEFAEAAQVVGREIGRRGWTLVYGGGGVGTLDELFEAWSWSLAGLQDKPSGLLNTAGYYDDLVRFLDRSVADGLLRAQARSLLTVGSGPVALLDSLGDRVQRPTTRS